MKRKRCAQPKKQQAKIRSFRRYQTHSGSWHHNSQSSIHTSLTGCSSFQMQSLGM